MYQQETCTRHAKRMVRRPLTFMHMNDDERIGNGKYLEKRREKDETQRKMKLSFIYVGKIDLHLAEHMNKHISL